MPTQAEVEYYKLVHQKFTWHKLSYSLLIGLTGAALTLPFELLKVRSQALSEGKLYNGYGLNKHNSLAGLFNEIYDSGKKSRGFFIGLDTILAKSLLLNSSRTFIWCSVYNHFNTDPRSKNNIFYIN